MSARKHSLRPWALALGALGWAWVSGCRGPAKVSQAPDFALQDLEGHAVSLNGLRGKVVLLDFWATWCGPCHESIPFFESLYEKNRRSGFVVVGIDEDAEEGDVRRFVRRTRMTYPVVMDASNRLMDDYQVAGLPTTFLLDPRGRVRARWVGFAEDIGNDMEKTLKSLLDERGN